MARYAGRHRNAPTVTSAHAERPASAPADHPVTASQARSPHAGGRRRTLRPLVAVGAAAGVAFGVLGLTSSASGGQGDPVDLSMAMVSQTDVLARAAVTQTATRAQQDVSRDVTRVALSATAVEQVKSVTAQASAAKKAKAAAAERARRKAAEQKRLAVVANAKANPRATARALMREHGWTGDAQYGCLVNLWNGESNWTWSAHNAGSGAYGIPQSLPAGKMARFGSDYRTNPVTQIKWGLWYIESSYGSPCNAWSTWQARSPHWY